MRVICHIMSAADHYFSESPRHVPDMFVLVYHRIMEVGGHLHVLEDSIVYQPS